MFDTIKKNKRESLFIISIFIIVITLIIYYICMALDMGTISIVIALVFSVVSAWSSYYYSDKIVLKLNNARPATREENLQLVNILDSLVVASGLNVTPALYVMDDPQPNAFATGRDPSHSAICVTTGLLQKLDYYAEQFINGRLVYQRFSPFEQHGCSAGGATHVIASLLAGAKAASDRDAAPDGDDFKRELQRGAQQADCIERWARAVGCWTERIDDSLPKMLGNQIAEGGEAFIVLNSKMAEAVLHK